jgi:hypothetical protein
MFYYTVNKYFFLTFGIAFSKFTHKLQLAVEYLLIANLILFIMLLHISF